MRMGQGKNKNSTSKLDRFLLFFCQSQLAGHLCQSIKSEEASFPPTASTLKWLKTKHPRPPSCNLLKNPVILSKKVFSS